MQDTNILDIPAKHQAIIEKSKEIGFSMPSDLYIGTLLKTLISSKPHGQFLELGTGIGLSLSWMIDGMDTNSLLISIDNNPDLIAIAENYFGEDKRVKLICTDASEWLQTYKGTQFDLIFADAWPGKYSDIERVLDIIKVGGFYILDDMLPQPNWPEGHQANVDRLIAYLENRSDLVLTKMNWSTGLIVCVKK